MTRYAKLINDIITFPPINDYDRGIMNYNLDIPQLIADGYKEFIEVERPQTIRFYHISYDETSSTIEEVIVYDETQEEAEARIAQQERNRLDQLTLTPSDVERALYYSDLHMDFDDLKALIAQQLPQVDLKGLAIEFRANNFYRGAVDVNGNRIIDMVGAILGYNSQDMDYLFEHKELPIKES